MFEEIEYLKKKRIQLMFMYIMAVVLIIVFYFSTKITNETIKLIFGIFSVLPSLALICIAYLQREKYDFLYRKEVVSKFIKKVDNLDFNENFNYKVNYEREYRNLK